MLLTMEQQISDAVHLLFNVVSYLFILAVSFYLGYQIGKNHKK